MRRAHAKVATEGSDDRVVTVVLAFATVLAIARVVSGIAVGEPYNADLGLAMLFTLVGVWLLVLEARDLVRARSSRRARHRTIRR